MPSVITPSSFDLIFDSPDASYKLSDHFVAVREWMVPKSLLCPPTDEILLAFESVSNHLGNLIDLYMNDVRSHFYRHACPVLNSSIFARPFTDKEAFRLVDTLNDLRRHYYYPFEFIDIPENIYMRFHVCYSSLLNSLFSPDVFQSVATSCLQGQNLFYPDQTILDAVSTLREMGKEASLNQIILSHILHDIEHHARNKYGKTWDCSVLQDMKDWINNIVLPSAQLLIPHCEEDITLVIRGFSLDTIATMRTEELFDIVVDYPDSRYGLEDLKVVNTQFQLTRS